MWSFGIIPNPVEHKIPPHHHQGLEISLRNGIFLGSKPPFPLIFPDPMEFPTPTLDLEMKGKLWDHPKSKGRHNPTPPPSGTVIPPLKVPNYDHKRDIFGLKTPFSLILPDPMEFPPPTLDLDPDLELREPFQTLRPPLRLQKPPFSAHKRRFLGTKIPFFFYYLIFFSPLSHGIPGSHLGPGDEEEASGQEQPLERGLEVAELDALQEQHALAVGQHQGVQGQDLEHL